jgi:hypothetical protein
MKIEDRIYGVFSVEAPVLRELVTTPSFERLQRIAQFGIPDRYYHLKNFSRYEHSLGVMILLAKLGASEAEQVAGLLHDVSHTAFSHVIDWVMGDSLKEDYQDKHHESVVVNSEIADILRKYGYDPQGIANFERFPLLDRHAPDLCADRVDYAFREFPRAIAKECFGHVTVAHQKVVFDSQESAYLFAHNFLLLQMNHWGGYEAVSRYRIFADVLRQAIQEGVIEYDDFWQDDEHVLSKLERDGREEISAGLRVLRNRSLASLPQSSKVVQKKFRHVDPEFLDGDVLVRLSDVDEDWRQELQAAREENSLGIQICDLADVV